MVLEKLCLIFLYNFSNPDFNEVFTKFTVFFYGYLLVYYHTQTKFGARLCFYTCLSVHGGSASDGSAYRGVGRPQLEKWASCILLESFLVLQIKYIRTPVLSQVKLLIAGHGFCKRVQKDIAIGTKTHCLKKLFSVKILNTKHSP